MNIWTLTVYATSGVSLVTMAFPTEEECYSTLRENYDPENEHADLDDDGLVNQLIRNEGFVIDIDEHTLPAPKIEILHGRDPDSECALDVFVDGVRVTDFVEEDIDPGRGWTRSDWDERIEENEADTTSSPAFKAAVDQALKAYGDSQYITEDH